MQWWMRNRRRGKKSSRTERNQRMDSVREEARGKDEWRREGSQSIGEADQERSQSETQQNTQKQEENPGRTTAAAADPLSDCASGQDAPSFTSFSPGPPRRRWGWERRLADGGRHLPRLSSLPILQGSRRAGARLPRLLAGSRSALSSGSELGQVAVRVWASERAGKRYIARGCANKSQSSAAGQAAKATLARRGALCGSPGPALSGRRWTLAGATGGQARGRSSNPRPTARLEEQGLLGRKR